MVTKYENRTCQFEYKFHLLQLLEHFTYALTVVELNTK